MDFGSCNFATTGSFLTVAVRMVVKMMHVTVDMFVHIKSVSSLIDFRPEIQSNVTGCGGKNKQKFKNYSDSCNCCLLVCSKSRGAKW